MDGRLHTKRFLVLYSVKYQRLVKAYNLLAYLREKQYAS